MKREIIYTMFFIGSVLIKAFAQQDADNFDTPPPQQWINWFNDEVEKYKEKLQTGKIQTNNYTIPVIVHIVHTGQPVGVFPEY